LLSFFLSLSLWVSFMHRHTCARACTHTHTHTHTHTRTRAHTHTHTHIHISLSLSLSLSCTHTRTHTHTCMCVLTLTRTHILTNKTAMYENILLHHEVSSTQSPGVGGKMEERRKDRERYCLREVKTVSLFVFPSLPFHQIR